MHLKFAGVGMALLILFLGVRYVLLLNEVNNSALELADGQHYCWLTPKSSEFPSYDVRAAGGRYWPSIFRAIGVSIFTDPGKRPVHFALYIQEEQSRGRFYRWQYRSGSFVGGSYESAAPALGLGGATRECDRLISSKNEL